MSNLYGCRKVKVFNGITEAEIDLHGSYGYVEIENEGEEAVNVTVNDFPEQGHKGTMLKVKAGETRHLPLVVYKVKATGAVNITAFGL